MKCYINFEQRYCTTLALFNDNFSGNLLRAVR